MAELKFTPNFAGEGEGLSDAGIETYRDDPFPAVARETSQNSRDAHDRARCAGEPVRVEVELIEVPAATLPAIRRYREVVDLCLAKAQATNRKKEISFFTQAQRVLSADSVPILRISDYNTTGLTGPCIEGKPFHSLVKSSGVSDKPDDTSGGSFGIGKSAVYSASDLQTAFYSTIWQEGEQGHFLAQGKTKFRSFTDSDGEEFLSVGYWGEPEGYMPVGDPEEVPEWLRRREIGTTVCSVAVRRNPEWQKEYARSLVTNFFSAIHGGSMEFVIDGDSINRNTLSRRFAELKAETGDDDFTFAYEMYCCLADDHDTIHREIDLEGVGTFDVRIAIREGLPKRVGILRNGMYICDTLGSFGDKFRHFPMYRDFVAVVEPADDTANAWLRQMENPKHDALSAERLLDPEDRLAAADAGRKLAERIRELIRDQARKPVEDETELEELSEFFALDNQGREDESGQRSITTFRVRKSEPPKRRRQTRPPLTTDDGEEGGAGGSSGTGPGEGSGTGGGIGGGDAGTGTRRRPPAMPLANPRTRVMDPQKPSLRRIWFTPERDGVAVLSFASGGLSDPVTLETVPGEIRVNCRAGERQSADITFATEFTGPVEITSWEDDDETEG